MRVKRVCCVIVIIVLFVFCCSWVIKKIINERDWREWSKTNVGKAVIYATEGSSFKCLSEKTDETAEEIKIFLGGQGDCVNVVNRFEEYRRKYLDLKLLNKKIQIFFYSNEKDGMIYLVFKNFIDGECELHDEIDVAQWKDTAGACYVKYNQNNDSNIEFLEFEPNMRFDNKLGVVKFSSKLFVNLKSVKTGCEENSDEFHELKERIQICIPDCVVE